MIDVQVIVPNKRVQAEATVVSKAADTVKMGAALGPWVVANREAGQLADLCP